METVEADMRNLKDESGGLVCSLYFLFNSPRLSYKNESADSLS